MPTTVSISVKVPANLNVPRSVLKRATATAQEVVDGSLHFEALAADLRKRGFTITAAELQKRSSGKVASTGARRKRVTLTEAQKKKLIAGLQAGATASSAAAKFGVSISTVAKLKSAAGLVKKKAAQKK